MNTTDLTRKTDLAKIHIGKKDLHLEDADYEAIILRVSKGRTSSAGELDWRERGQVLAHYKRCGWLPRHKQPAGAGYSRPVKASSDEARKVRALWLLLHELGLVRDASERALGNYCKRVLKVDALQWADGKLYKLIEGLKDWAMRALPAKVDAMRGQLAPHHAALPPELSEELQSAHRELRRTEANDRRFDAFNGMYQALKAGLNHISNAQEAGHGIA